MTKPESFQGGEYNQAGGIPNPERYWRLHNKLHKIFDTLDIRVEGKEHLEDLKGRREGAVVAPTHDSWLDIIALSSLNLPKPMRFMGKKILSRVPYVGKLGRDAGAFWVDRSDPASRRAALDTAIELLDEGEIVTIFPKGTRKKDGVIRPGAARAALASEGAVIAPIGLGYNKHFGFHSPRRIGLVVGELIYPDRQQDTPEALTEELSSTLSHLQSRAMDLAHR